jgi:bifunctional non-homologous end joining protein LigD
MAKPRVPRDEEAERGPAGPLPATFTAQLAEPAAVPPGGDDWLHEIKIDGYRIGCRIDRGTVRLLGRRGSTWTDKFPEVVRAAQALPVTTALLDGEVTVLDADGRSRFHALQDLLSGGPRARLMYFVFDLLHLDGEDLTNLPLRERKRRLRALLGGLSPELPLRAVDSIQGNGAAVFEGARRLGLEGIVSKRAEQPYRAGRGAGWLKIKCAHRQEIVVGGFSLPKGARTGIGALFCGTYDADGRLRFAGKVGTGFSARVSDELHARLAELKRETCPFEPPPEALIRRGAQWTEPVVVAEVRFSNWTADGRLRHASFEGLRVDKRARDVRREG